MIISFAWTTPALLAGAKTATRRDWNNVYASRFVAGELVAAWNQTPRVNSARRGIAIARKVATIRLTRAPHREWSTDLTEADYAAEGFVWLRANGHGETVDRVMRNWGDLRRLLWVVEFELVELVDEHGFAAGGILRPDQAPVLRGER